MADPILDYGDPDTDAMTGGDATLVIEPGAASEAAHSGFAPTQDLELNPHIAPQEVYADDDEQMQDAGENGGFGPRIGKNRFYALPPEEAAKAGITRATPTGETEEISTYEDDSPPPPAPKPTSGADIRLTALHIQGTPVQQFSTSRLFAYVTHYGAQPLGLEWVNDQRCNIVFSSVQAAYTALEYLCPAKVMTSEPLVPFPRLDELQGATPDSWDGAMTSSLVLPRRAHSVPTRLYTATERETAAAAAPGSEAQASSLPDDVPEIYREMEAAEREAAANTPERQALTRLRGAIWVRYALESTDIKPADAARRSAWYQEHGLDAGREVVPRLLSVGDASDRLELFPDRDQRDDPAWIQKKDRRSSGIASGSGGMSSLPERPNWLSSAARGRGGRRAAMDNLDEELDSLQAARESSSGAPGGSDDLLDGSRSTSRWGHDGYESRGRGSRRSNGAGGKAAMDALDEELDALNSRNRARSSSPARVGSGSSGRNNEQVRIRGRGAMRAPTSTWDDVDGDDAMRVGSGNFRGRMVADDLYPENHSRGGRGRGGRRRGGDRWEDDDAPAGAAGLADRLSPANGASSLEARLSDRLGGSGSGSLSGRLAPREGGEGSLAARFS